MTWWQRFKTSGEVVTHGKTDEKIIRPFDGVRDHDITAYAKKMKNVVLN